MSSSKKSVMQESVSPSPSPPPPQWSSDRWTVTLSGLATLASLAGGLLFVGGKAYLDGFAGAWGLTPGFYGFSNSDVIYAGYIGQLNDMSFVAAALVGLGVVYVFAVAALAVPALVMESFAWIKRRFFSRIDRHETKSPASPNAVLAKRLMRAFNLLMTSAASIFIGAIALGTVVLVSLAIFSADQQDAGMARAIKDRNRIESANREGCEGADCRYLAQPKRVTYLVRDEAKQLTGRTIECGKSWCAFYTTDNLLIELPRDSMLIIENVPEAPRVPLQIPGGASK